KGRRSSCAGSPATNAGLRGGRKVAAVRGDPCVTGVEDTVVGSVAVASAHFMRARDGCSEGPPSEQRGRSGRSVRAAQVLPGAAARGLLLPDCAALLLPDSAAMCSRETPTSLGPPKTANACQILRGRRPTASSGLSQRTFPARWTRNRPSLVIECRPGRNP